LDIWSIGCIFAELLYRKPLFPGKNTAEQIELIVSVLGTPKLEDIYKEGRENSRELVYKFGKVEKYNWDEIIPNASKEAKDLLDRFLKFSPDKRITIEEALNHPYFSDIKIDESEEEVVEPILPFDFDFEDTDVDVPQVKDLILHEIMLYHHQELLNEYEKKKEEYKRKMKEK